MEQLFKVFLTAISPALQTLLVTLVTILLGQLSAYLAKQYQIAKGRLSSEQQYFLEFLVSRAVDTVEQLYKDEANVVKRDKAISIVEDGLAQAGITVDINVIVAALEAQVFNKKSRALSGPLG